MSSDVDWMRHALQLARYAQNVLHEVPVGAVLVYNNELLAEGYNSNITNCDPTAHAEIVALRHACLKVKNYRIPKSIMYITLEPCAMCAMALVHARVERVVYAAPDPKTGAAGSVFDVLDTGCNNHRIGVTSGVLALESEQLLKRFFQARRAANKRTLDSD